MCCVFTCGMWNLPSLSFAWFIGTSYYVSEYAYTFICAWSMYVTTYVWMNECMYVCMYLCPYVRMQVCRYTCTYICKYACIYACMFCVCTWVYFTKQNCKYWIMFLFVWSWTCYFLSISWFISDVCVWPQYVLSCPGLYIYLCSSVKDRKRVS